MKLPDPIYRLHAFLFNLNNHKTQKLRPIESRIIYGPNSNLNNEFSSYLNNVEKYYEIGTGNFGSSAGSYFKWVKLKAITKAQEITYIYYEKRYSPLSYFRKLLYDYKNEREFTLEKLVRKDIKNGRLIECKKNKYIRDYD